MDDDAPLAALATAKFDDDMPLASLASAAPPKSSKAPGGGKGRPPGAKPAGGALKSASAPKPKGKGAPAKKKPGDSSSSDSSSSDSSSSSEGEGKPKKKRAAPSKAKRVGMLKKLKSAGSTAGSTGELEGQEDAEEIANHKVTKRDRAPKQQVVAELLCRWWYVLPDWPPNDDAYYKEKLDEKKCRQVTIQEWEWVPEEDEKGCRKVYQLTQFRGLFRNSAGDLVDCRPQDTCPCYGNLMKKELPDLYSLLVVAYENQIKDLVNSKYLEVRHKKELETHLNRVKDKAYKARSIGGRSKTA